jgi:hypothetical protein
MNDPAARGTDIPRESWDAVVAAFEAFFSGLGVVEAEPDAVRFSGAPRVDTGLALRRDGTSASFMPLHGLEARWERVRFDHAAGEVVLSGDGVTYRYQVPPSLRRGEE